METIKERHRMTESVGMTTRRTGADVPDLPRDDNPDGSACTTGDDRVDSQGGNRDDGHSPDDDCCRDGCCLGGCSQDDGPGDHFRRDGCDCPDCRDAEAGRRPGRLWLP